MSYKLNKDLKPFESVSEKMASEKHITASAIVPILESLRESKAAEGNEDSGEFTCDIINQIHSELIKYFHSRYSLERNPETILLLIICTYLDPLFKKDYLTDDTYSHVISKLKNIAMTGKEHAATIPQETKNRGLSLIIKKGKHKQNTEIKVFSTKL